MPSELSKIEQNLTPPCHNLRRYVTEHGTEDLDYLFVNAPAKVKQEIEAYFLCGMINQLASILAAHPSKVRAWKNRWAQEWSQEYNADNKTYKDKHLKRLDNLYAHAMDMMAQSKTMRDKTSWANVMLKIESMSGDFDGSKAPAKSANINANLNSMALPVDIIEGILTERIQVEQDDATRRKLIEVKREIITRGGSEVEISEGGPVRDLLEQGPRRASSMD